MKYPTFSIRKPLQGLSLLFFIMLSQHSFACGGFFCDVVPINQAGEQIIFRQQGGETTAMIKIDYVGNAEDFGWVLPVPNTPDISLGSDLTFTELEANTRPQFLLERVGSGCGFDSSSSSSSVSFSSFSSSSSGSTPTGVVIEKEISVGPFDAKVISSDDAEALAFWLEDNNLDLTDRGSELLAPYIQAKSKFVVLKLKSNTSVGSIQPIVLKYQSSAPVIPMTLTAVAAQNNMGVLVWLLGEGRGVPKNFHHVTPNYTRLNWFRGTRSAYASYQGLITQAMDEAGGQGFATDFAGYLPTLSSQLTTSARWKVLLPDLEKSSDANFISLAWNELNTVVQSTIRSTLPTSSSFIYQSPLDVLSVFTSEQLQQARPIIMTTIQEQVIAPLDNAIDILDDNLYLTRLYTTLSADEMNKNPEFTFNTAMEDQPLNRNATLTASCTDEQTNWTLKLGKGTGREDEIVIESWEGFIPSNAMAGVQSAVWRVEKTSATADPVLLSESKLSILSLGVKRPANSSSSSSSTSSVSSSTSSSSSSSSSGGSKSGGSVDVVFLLFFSLLLAVKCRAWPNGRIDL